MQYKLCAADEHVP